MENKIIKPAETEEKTVNIESLKKGDYFKLPGRATRIYVYDGYNRYSKKYAYYRFDDVNHYKDCKKGTPVVNDIDF